jgi:hypothetical protein
MLNYHKYIRPLNLPANNGVVISLMTNYVAFLFAFVLFFAKRAHSSGVLLLCGNRMKKSSISDLSGYLESLLHVM